MTSGEYLPPRRRPDFDPAAFVDRALRGGLSFGIDRDGTIWRWEAMPEMDPGPSETYRRLCVELDNNRLQVRDEITRRAHEQGIFKAMDDIQVPGSVHGYVFLCGTPCFGMN